MLSLRSMTSFLFLLSVGILFLCSGSQAHRTASTYNSDRDSHPRKWGTLSIVPKPATSLSFVGKEAKVTSENRVRFQTQIPMQQLQSCDKSPSDVWLTSRDTVAFDSRPAGKVLNAHFPVPVEDTTLVQRRTPVSTHMRPTTQRGNEKGASGSRILVRMVSGLVTVFMRYFRNEGIEATTSSDRPPSPADQVDNMLVLANNVELRRHGRSLLRDISPPGMWPITSDDDELSLEGSQRVRRFLLAADSTVDVEEKTLNAARDRIRHGRSLLRDISPPGMWPVGSDDDELETSRRRSLLAAQLSTENTHHSSHGRSLLRDVSPQGMWPTTTDDNELDVSRRKSRMLLSTDSSSSAESKTKDEFSRKHGGRSLLRDISPPRLWPVTSDDKFDTSHRRALLAEGVSEKLSPAQLEVSGQRRNHGRALLRDISPPGMWPITSDDDEFEGIRRRALLSDDKISSEAPGKVEGHHLKRRRSLLRNTSPSGMWPVSSDDEYEITTRRAVLSTGKLPSSARVLVKPERRRHQHGRALLRDISPPGMWPVTSDDDEFEFSRRRSLLEDDKTTPSASAVPAGDQHLKHSRALLRDISPPELWPIISDDDDFEMRRRRALLSDETHSSSADATRNEHDHQHGRALLRDISPPGMWQITSDDDEFEVTRRRALVSGDTHSSSYKASTDNRQHKQGRALLRDISPPGMWPVIDDQEVFVRK